MGESKEVYAFIMQLTEEQLKKLYATLDDDFIEIKAIILEKLNSIK